VRSWRSGALALAALLVACGGGCGGGEEAAEDTGPWGSLKERPCPEESYLTYDDFGGPFLLTWCDGCHSVDLPDGSRQGAPLGVDFDTIDDVRRQKKRIWARAGDQNDTMPPIGGPDEEERALLGEWLACGAP
jgi:hypothetical protein